jgi:hypothetical protein
MSKRKIQRNNNLHLLDGQQLEALGQFQKDFKQAMPHMQAMARAAQELRDAMVHAPLWRVIEAEKPEDAEEPEVWSVGHAQVNYVDSIKTEGTQG